MCILCCKNENIGSRMGQAGKNIKNTTLLSVLFQYFLIGPTPGLFINKFVFSFVWIVWIQLVCLCSINNRLTYLVTSKPVKQEVSRTVILLLTKR